MGDEHRDDAPNRRRADDYQGDVASPNTKIPTIAAAVASGVNMNEWVHESIECPGAGTEPYTDAQFESVAHLVAAASKATGLPINRSTVVVHADINRVSRRSDPLAGGRRPRQRAPQMPRSHGAWVTPGSPGCA
jgi:N-acetyl-anhydromuramyl-L-alanine amidase AmpD